MSDLDLPKLVGLSGYARSGKDTIADFLVAEHNYTRLAFADLLRLSVYLLNPWIGLNKAAGGAYCDHADSACEEFHLLPCRIRYADGFDFYGYEGLKASPYGDEVRRLLQVMGTEVARELFGDDFWVNAIFKDINPDGRYVVTDCRFPNEAQGITDRNGFMLRVRRPGFGPANGHASETAIDDWYFDATVVNDGTINELQLAAVTALALLSEDEV